MIGKLRGIVDIIHGSRVILDVGGVGYTVTCSSQTLRQLKPNSEAVLMIETQVREDAISLFGFKDEVEQDWFKLLTTVQGVGAKVALSILSSVAPENLSAIMVSQDKAALTKADGVGPKLALRLVTELKDKVANFAAKPNLELRSSSSPMTSALNQSHVINDAVSVLINLGYPRHVAFQTVNMVVRSSDETDQSVETPKPLDVIIRLSLASLSKKENAA